MIDSSKPAADRQKSPAARGERERLPLNAYTILVVTADPAHGELIRKMLGALGYRALQANDGIEALDRIHRQPEPDLILMGIDLPRMNGNETIAAIRQLSSPMRKLPIAAITTNLSLELLRDLPNAGADVLLDRPFDMRELSRTVASLLRGRLEDVDAESLRRSFGVSP